MSRGALAVRSLLACVFLYILFLSYRVYFWDGLPSSVTNAFFDTVVSYLATSLIYFIINPVAKGNKWITTLGAILIVSASFYFLKLIHYYVYTWTGVMDAGFKKIFESRGFQIFDVLTIIIVGMSGTYAYIKYLESEMSRKMAESILYEKNMAELRFLRGQVNPHFLFNSLNLIYFSIEKKNENARSLLSSFSDMLRYQVYHTDGQMVSYLKELAFIEQYLHLYSSRMRENTELRSNIDKPMFDVQVPPLILLPFIENAFKHSGHSLGNKSLIDLQVRIDEGWLVMDINNTKGNKPGLPAEDKGIGISNVRRRLELLFGQYFILDIQDTATWYKVHLQIPIQ